MYEISVNVIHSSQILKIIARKFSKLRFIYLTTFAALHWVLIFHFSLFFPIYESIPSSAFIFENLTRKFTTSYFCFKQQRDIFDICVFSMCIAWIWKHGICEKINHGLFPTEVQKEHFSLTPRENKFWREC